MRRKARSMAVASLLLAAVACGGGSGPGGEPSVAAPTAEGPAADIVIDVTDPGSGTAIVEIAFSGLEAKRFRSVGKDPEYVYPQVTFWDEDGDRIGHEVKGQVFTLDRAPGKTVNVRYVVRPGGEGRHGNQGAITDEFALFDGRLYIMPMDAPALKTARIRFEAPEGWSVASPFREENGWWVVDQFGSHLVYDELAGSCFGAGKFDQATKQVGNTEVRSFSFSAWDQAHKDALADKTFRMFSWFHDNVGFDLGAPYIALWTPKSTEMRLFGGSHANGTCFEHPTDTLRNWQLLGHRIGHSVNKYSPSGIQIRDAHDKWFKEGWASYVEVMSTAGTGIAADERYWNFLYERYKNWRRDHPEYDMALGDEPHAKGDAIEFLHYTKGPIIVKMLDVWMQKRTGRSMRDFMAAMWPKYGMYKGEFPLREELEAFTGESLEEFWFASVDTPGTVIPMWPEAATPEVKRAAKAPGVASVGGRKITAAYLRALAASGDFERYADIPKFLVAAERRRRELDAHGVKLLPDVVAEHVAGLDGIAQHDIDRYVLRWRLDLYPGMDAKAPAEQPDAVAVETTGGEGEAPGEGGADDKPTDAAEPAKEAPAEPAPIDFELDTSTEEGRVFGELLALEQTYEESLPGKGGLVGVDVHIGTKDGPHRLQVGAKDKITVVTKWQWTPTKMDLSLHAQGETGKKRTVVIEPSWTRVWSEFEASELPAGGDILLVTVSAGGGETTRAYWVRR